MIRSEQPIAAKDAFSRLQQLAKQRPRMLEHCDLCRADVLPGHPHLIELSQRHIFCACDACAMLFTGRSDAKYKRVPRTIRQLPSFQLSDADWDSLLIPINLAFFFKNSLADRITVLYPSPAGATESLLPISAWSTIVEANPDLLHLEPDVEALLVNRVGRAREVGDSQYFIVPIDQCYRLVGLIRLHWRGLSGGTEVWQEIGNFFAELSQRAEVPGPDHS
jgi:uncharacterized protein DUF5947